MSGEPRGQAWLRAMYVHPAPLPRYLANDAWTQAWGISWCADRREDVVWIQQSGGLPGFTTTVCFDPRAQVGAVVLVNGTSGSAELGCDLGSIARRLVLAAPPVIGAPEPMPGHYRPLLGLYVRPQLGGWVLCLEWRDGNLVFTSPETAAWSLTLAPTTDPDVFLAEPASDFAGEKVSFQRLVDGRVASVLLINSTFCAAGAGRSAWVRRCGK